MATQLFNAYQAFTDNNGLPLAGGFVFMYVPLTTTPKDTWTDQLETTLNANPIVLDASGRAQIWGNGQYRQILKDSLGNQIWDQITGVAEATPAPDNQYVIIQSPTQPVDQGGLWRFESLIGINSDFQLLPAAGIELIENTAAAGDFSSFFTGMQYYLNINMTTNVGHFPNPPGVPLGNDGSLIWYVNRFVQSSNNQLLASIALSVTAVAGTVITGIAFVGPNRSGYTAAGLTIPVWFDCRPLPSIAASATILTIADGAGGFHLDPASLTLVSGGLGYPAAPANIAAGAAGPPTGPYDVGPQFELFRNVVMNNGSTGAAIYFECLDSSGLGRVNGQIATFVLNADTVNFTSELVFSTGGPYATNAGVQPELAISNGLWYPDPLGVTTARGLGHCDFFAYSINGVEIPDFRSTNAAGINVRALALSGGANAFALLSLGNATNPQEGGLLMPGIGNANYAGPRSVNLVSNNGAPIADYQGLVEARRLIYNAGAPIHLFGKTVTDFSQVGVEINLNGAVSATATSNSSLNLNRLGTDGATQTFQKASIQVGNITVSGAGTSYNTISDARYKQDLEAFDGLELVRSTKAQQGRFKADPMAPLRPMFVAQDFAGLMPHLIHEVDGIYTMDYAGVTPVLWRAIQQLDARVNQLEAKQ